LEQRIKEQQFAELQQQKTELEMQALRAQMNPHFIFNSREISGLAPSTE
jgi:sensor histidine kinase YesM